VPVLQAIFFQEVSATSVFLQLSFLFMYFVASLDVFRVLMDTVNESFTVMFVKNLKKVEEIYAADSLLDTLSE